jgi:glycosyltransferase 2 family protein
MNKIPRWLVWFEVGFSLLLLGGLVYYFADQGASLLDRLRDADLAFLALGALALLLQAVVASARWRVVTGLLTRSLTSRQAVEYFFTAQFFSQCLPGSIGGDAVRVALHARHGAGWRSAGIAVAVDRVYGMATLLAIGAAALTLPEAATLAPPWLRSLGLPLALLLATIGFLLPFLGPLRRLVPKHRSSHLDSTQALTAAPVAAVELLLTSFLVHGMSLLALWAFMHAVSSPVDLSIVTIALPAALVLAVLPVSFGGWGVREGVLVGVMGLYGVPADGALAGSVLFGLMLAAVSLPGGILWLVPGRISHYLATTRRDQAQTSEVSP